MLGKSTYINGKTIVNKGKDDFKGYLFCVLNNMEVSTGIKMPLIENGMKSEAREF